MEPLKTCFRFNHIVNHIVQGLRYFACAIHWDGGNSSDVGVHGLNALTVEIVSSSHFLGNALVLQTAGRKYSA